ncbi:MAG: calcineurin-like phosphoesterase [Segetibacter sp.]|nr:calcineurin-like phosphoesterase [Segetibacter sp.]
MIFLAPGAAFTQAFKFAFLSDTHIGVKNADEDLRRTIADINADPSIQFVIISGDITENSFDEEMWEAKSILSKLNKPLHIVTGNHDTYWSPNGGRIFTRVFGGGRFLFEHKGYMFIGTNAGPNMQHKAPGQVPKEDLVWLDSVLNNLKDKNIPIVYVNHYPQDQSQRNSHEAIERLKKKNIQLFLVGHGHQNKQYTFDGVPGIMGRTNTRGSDSTGAYNIVTFSNGKATFEERKALSGAQRKWAEATLIDHHFTTDTTRYPRPSYAMNSAYTNVKKIWQHEEKYDIGSGTAIKDNLVIATSNEGFIYALDEKDGSRKWTFRTKGKVYSTPVVSGNFVVAPCTDSMIYCLDATTGSLLWKFRSSKPFVSSPVVKDAVVFIGSSDGHFRAINLKDGKMKWDFNGVKDFVMTKPLLYNNNVYFGSWGNELYALNISNGELSWKWKDTSNTRMSSPAGCKPVGTDGKVFIVAPDQFITSFDATSGNVIWRATMPDVKVRESMGLSTDSSLVYVKTTDGKLIGISTSATSLEKAFSVDLKLSNDICAAAIVESKGLIFVPSNAGVVSAVDSQTKKLLWQYKVSDSMVNSVMPIGDNKLIVATVDGKIYCLKY